jgi:hypothetical protein
MKGASVLISHAIYLLLTIIVLGSLIAYASSARNDMNEQMVDAQLSVIAESIRGDVVKLSLLSKESEYPYDSTVSIAKFDLDFPKAIGGRDDTVILSENLITLESTTSEGAAVKVTKDVNIDITMEGSAMMPAYLELIRTASGDKIRVAER